VNGRAYTGKHWTANNVLVLAFNEGGGPPVTANLWLWRGWLPVGFYVAVYVGKWIRFSRVAEVVYRQPELLLDERVMDWPGAPAWDYTIHGEPR
jgi:hypothetical protein